MTAVIATAVRGNWTRVIGITAVPNPDNTVVGVKKSGAGVARRNDAVEHIDTAAHAFDQVFRFPYPHQVTRLVGGQQG